MMKTCFLALLFAALSLTSGANSLSSSKGGKGDSSISSRSSSKGGKGDSPTSSSPSEKSGKGKGGKGDKKSSKKDSKKDSKKGKKSKKGLSPSAPVAPSSKGGSKGGKGGPSAPVWPPSRKGSSHDGPARPPSPIPHPPTSGPAGPAPPTSPPTNDTPVSLNRYAVAYTLGDNAMPMREDYMEVAMLTDTFFEEYMKERYADSTQATLLRFETTMVTSNFRFGEPVVVDYDSTAYFSEDSILPRKEVLDAVLMQVFDDPVPYITRLAALDSTNAFSTTTAVEFTEPDMMAVVSTRNTTKSASPAAIAAGAIGFTLLVAGIILYRRRDGEEEGYFNQKGFDNKQSSSSGHGDVTVAGETYAGETYDGTASYCRSSGPSRDEEQGLENVDLSGSSTDDTDTSSLAQAWDGGTIAENESDDRSKDDDDESDDDAESLKDEAAEGIEEDARSMMEEADEDMSIGESDTNSLISEEERTSPLQEKEFNPLGEDELLDELSECISQQDDEELEHLGEGQVESNETNQSEAVIDEDNKVSGPRGMALEDFDAFLDSSAEDAQTLSSLGNGTEFLEESPSSLDGEQYVGEEEDRSYSGTFSNRPLSVAEIEHLLESDM